MDPRLTFESVEALVAELRRKADDHRVSTESKRGRRGAPAVTIRLASPRDDQALNRLAQLDSAEPPTGATLVAEVHGKLVAALPLDGGRALADPFRRTAGVLRLLELRAAQLKAGDRARPRRLLADRIYPRAAER